MVFCPPFSTEPMTHAGTYHGIDHTLGAMGEKRRVGAGGGGGRQFKFHSPLNDQGYENEMPTHIL